MLIEQFDTGLKSKKDIKDINLSPKENHTNKLFVRNELKKIFYNKNKNLEKNLQKLFDKNLKVNCFHPINEFDSLENLKSKFYEPLFKAFPDIERRELMVVGGAFRDKIQVGSISILSGIFKNPWLGVNPNFKMINLRCCEIHEIKNGKIIESHILIDTLDFIRQLGIWPINISRGSEGSWHGPYNTDGLDFYEEDSNVSKNNLKQATEMNRSLNYKPELENLTDQELKERLLNHPQKEFWHKDMIWYGPCGIGTSRSLEGFIDMHQLPFRKSFSQRDYFKLGHYCEIGDGKFSLCAGWHSLDANYGKNDWLGYSAENQNVTMRVMDFYHHDEGKIRENWVPIDIAHILKQIGVDIFQLIKKQ